MSTKAWLDGHEFDLEDLAELLSTGDTRVAKDADGYYLTSTKLDGPRAGRAIYEVAQELLPTINGIGRSNNPRYRPVRLNGRYLDSDGRRMTVVHVGTAESRSRAHGATVGNASIPTTGARYATLADQDPNVAEALAIMGGSDPLGWVELYKVYEIVRDAVGPQGVEATGWVSASDLDAFGASANHPGVSGANARHARQRGKPPGKNKEMTIEEGRAFISVLISGWLDSLT